MLTIADYTVGEDRLSLMNNGEQWIEITPEANAAPRGVYGYYEAIDSADGLRIVGYHALTRQNPDGTVSYTYSRTYDITLRGVTRDEFMNGATGDGVIEGTAGRDIIRDDYVDADGDAIAASGNVIMAGAGHDLISLSVSDSVIQAGDGRDFVTIRGPGNLVHGEGGDDYLIARWQGSELDGGAGNDRLVADIRQGGDHVLTGGDGADSFEFLFGATRHAAQTEITDFDLGVDRLSVDGAEIDLSALPAGMLAGTDSDGSVILSVGLHDTMTLRGVTEADLGLVLI